MPIKSRWSVTVPEVSLHQWVFGSSDQPLSNERTLFDASQPDTHYLTMNTFRLWAKRVAVGLRGAGLQPGDRVLLFSGANPTYVARELAFQLKDSGAKFLLVADGSLDVAVDAISQIGMSKDRVFIFDNAALEGVGQGRLGIRNWNQLFSSVEEAKRYEWHNVKDPKETICCLNYSSGTTGVPKGVMITHYNYVSHGEQVINLIHLRPDWQERLQTERWLCMLPMYHAYGQAFFVSIGPKMGIPIYIMPKFHFIKMLQHIQDFKITTLTLAPPIAVALAKNSIVKTYDISSIRTAGSGAAPLAQAVVEEINALWPSGQVNLKQGWGMTETTCSAMGWHPLASSYRASVGEMLANCEARIMSEDGRAEVPAGQHGELWVRAPNVMKGYWRNEAATNETLTSDGWLKTGDICFVDRNGYFTVVDRKKELIKVKGNQVAPAELEAVLMEHDEVADCGVVGIAWEGDERPRAYVVLKQEAKNVEGKGREIARWMESRVARHKRLVGGCVVVDAIPKNPSGKILRKDLRERAKREVGDSAPRTSRL